MNSHLSRLFNVYVFVALFLTAALAVATGVFICIIIEQLLK